MKALVDVFPALMVTALFAASAAAIDRRPADGPVLEASAVKRAEVKVSRKDPAHAQPLVDAPRAMSKAEDEYWQLVAKYEIDRYEVAAEPGEQP